MRLNFLTNSNHILQEKMRYFSDYLSYVNQFLGKHPDIPFDNPSSLLHKIITQIQNNLDRCVKSVETHIKQLNNFPLTFLKIIAPNFDEVVNFFESWKTINKDHDKVASIKTNQDIINLLITVKNQFDDKLFDTSFEYLFNILTCEHGLERHYSEIELHTQVIVSVFRLNNVPEDQVSKYIDRILTREKYDFPLPLDILENLDEKSFKEASENFLRSRTFRQQFSGFKNIMEAYKNRKGFFLFPITGMQLAEEYLEEFEVLFDKVIFYSSMHKKFEEIRNEIAAHDLNEKALTKYSPHFFAKDIWLACVELNYEKKKETAIEARQIAEQELQFLKAFKKSANFSIHSMDFLFTKNFQRNDWSASVQWVGWERNVHHIGHFEVEDLVENPFMRLRNKEIKSAGEILKHERIFLRAFANDEISSYWIYLENLFWDTNTQIRIVRSIFSKIAIKLILDLVNEFSIAVYFAIEMYYQFNNVNLIGITKEDSNEIGRSIENRLAPPIKWSRYSKKTNHAFLTRMISKVASYEENSFTQIWREYFENLIQELSDYRNSELHAGIINEFSRIKLKTVLPSITSRIRWKIIHLAESHPSKSLSEILNLITQ